MKLSLFSLALGMTSIAGITGATMIPNSLLGFTLPAKGATVARAAFIPNVQARPVVPISALGVKLPITEPESQAEVQARDVAAFIPNVQARPVVPVSALGVKLPITVPESEAKVETRDDSASTYEKRTMIPDSELGFTLPNEPKLASRSAAWQRIIKASPQQA